MEPPGRSTRDSSHMAVRSSGMCSRTSEAMTRSKEPSPNGRRSASPRTAPTLAVSTLSSPATDMAPKVSCTLRTSSAPASNPTTSAPSRAAWIGVASEPTPQVEQAVPGPDAEFPVVDGQHATVSVGSAGVTDPLRLVGGITDRLRRVGGATAGLHWLRGAVRAPRELGGVGRWDDSAPGHERPVLLDRASSRDLPGETAKHPLPPGFAEVVRRTGSSSRRPMAAARAPGRWEAPASQSRRRCQRPRAGRHRW